MTRRTTLAVLLALAAALPAASQPPAKKFALLVGVNTYEHKGPDLPPLKFAAADAQETGELLEAQGYQVVLMTDQTGERDGRLRPTAENITRQLDALLGRYDRTQMRTVGGAVGSGDTIVIGLSGHGLRFERDPDGLNYFCPADAQPFFAEKGTLLSLESIVDRLKTSRAGVRLLLVDACRKEVAGAKGGVGTTLNVAQGIGVLLSCNANQKSYEDPGLKHGIFFYHVLEALRASGRDGAEPITWEDVSKHVRKHVPAAARKLKDADQNPIDLSNGLADPPALVYPSRPPAADAPFDEQRARDLQRAWARHLRREVEETITFGPDFAVRLEVVMVPPGKFTMGTAGDPAAAPHDVVLTAPIFVGKFEVTQKQFRTFYPNHVNAFSAGGPPAMAAKVRDVNTDDFPADRVPRKAAIDFCKDLTGYLRRNERWAGYECRLPTEAEWEFACRAGGAAAFHFGDECDGSQANCVTPQLKLFRPKKRGSYAANAFGLHDLHGNVAEWCHDYFAPYPQRRLTDPRGPEVGTAFVLRGGSYSSDPADCRSGARLEFDAGDAATPNVGFRVVIAPRR